MMVDDGRDQERPQNQDNHQRRTKQ